MPSPEETVTGQKFRLRMTGFASSLFRVPVSELERRIGYRFHSSLERSAIGDLCEAEGCNVSLGSKYTNYLTENILYQFQMMGVRDMQRYIILKSIKNAKNDKDLDKYLQRAKVHIVE